LNSVWVSDHVVHPATGNTTYPYSSTGQPPFRPEDGYLEALTVLSVVAGATETIGLGTSVLVLPARPLLVTAKAISTLDVLSQGRVILAVSAGWWRAEFEALGADFENRGATLDAQLEALRMLWGEGRGSASGPLITFPEVIFEPRPVQATGPELWIGGSGPRVWARIARSGATGWHGIGYDAERIREAERRIAEACATTGRDPLSVRISTATGLPQVAPKIRARLDGLCEAGVEQVVFIPRSDSVESIVSAIELLASELARRD
jgi:probable F420-dependent oxidoreductase